MGLLARILNLPSFPLALSELIQNYGQDNFTSTHLWRPSPISWIYPDLQKQKYGFSIFVRHTPSMSTPERNPDFTCHSVMSSVHLMLCLSIAGPPCVELSMYPPANSTQLNWKSYTLFVMAVWIDFKWRWTQLWWESNRVRDYDCK